MIKVDEVTGAECPVRRKLGMVLVRLGCLSNTDGVNITVYVVHCAHVGTWQAHRKS
jgi:hypothetical protein